MAIIKGLEWTFDTVAEQYEKWHGQPCANLFLFRLQA